MKILKNNRTPRKGARRSTKGSVINRKRGLSLSTSIVEFAKTSTQRFFTIRDACNDTKRPYESVKRTLNRLASTGKGSGPIDRIDRGLYRYAPEKKNESLQELMRQTNLKVENLCFVKQVPSETHSNPVSPDKGTEISTNGVLPNSKIPVPYQNNPYAQKLITGHSVKWDVYDCGTHMIRISANGAPPLNPDTVLLMINRLMQCGMDYSWVCASMELNIDSHKHRVDGSYSLQMFEGAILKAYQHGYNTRVELAYRRPTSMTELVVLLRTMSDRTEARENHRKVESMEKRLLECEKTARTAINVATKLWDREPGHA